MDRYAIYLRKSRADFEAESQGELETLLRHEKTLLELAMTMKIQVSQIYREIVSGEKIAARPVMKQLLQEVEQGIWTGILVMEVERLARGDAIDQQVVLNALMKGSTKIITPLKTYDLYDEYDEEYFEFGLFMSRRTLEIRDEYLPKKRNLLFDYDQVTLAQKKNEILKLLLNRVEYSKPNRNKKGQKDNDNFELVINPRLPDNISRAYTENIPYSVQISELV